MGGTRRGGGFLPSLCARGNFGGVRNEGSSPVAPSGAFTDSASSRGSTGNSRTRVLLAATVLCYVTLYGPQPLLPLFREQYALTTAGAGLIITLAMLPLSLGPIAYGQLLARAAPQLILRAGLVALGLGSVALTIAGSYPLVLGIRTLQGLLLPAILTTIAARIAAESHETGIRRALSGYVAATVAGGLSGRLLAGILSALGSWRLFFILVGVLLFAVAACLRPAGGTPVHPAQTGSATLRSLVANRRCMGIFVTAFCVFLVFSGLLNVLPFRVTQLSRMTAEWYRGAVYAGYTMGFAASLGSQRLTRLVGGERPVVLLGHGVLAAALLLTLVAELSVLFATVFLLCGAVFLIHATVAGHINRLGRGQENGVNGLYLSSYYCGGVLGSFGAGVILDTWGWPALITVFLAVVCVSVVGVLGGLSNTEVRPDGAGYDRDR